MSSNNGKSFDKIRHELKSFFRSSKTLVSGSGTSVSGTAQPGSFKGKEEAAVLTPEIELKMSPKTSTETRIKTLQVLAEFVKTNRLEENAVEKMCELTKDILQSSRRENRHVLFLFYQCLVQGQYDRIGTTRSFFFNVIKNHENRDDVVHRLELFKKLTENGKVILNFEEEVGIFLLDWMPAIVAEGKSTEFLEILVNYIKYNAAYIDEEIISGIVQNTAYLCCQSDVEAVVRGSLTLLDTIVCYSNINQQTMVIFICALGKTVCLEAYNSTGWTVMRNILGTHMGHYCIQTMCKMLLSREDDTHFDNGLICGIIFILNMGILHDKPDTIAGYIPSYIIPSIYEAAHKEDPIIHTEILYCIKWLVEKHGEKLKDAVWDRVFSIVKLLVDGFQKQEENLGVDWRSDIQFVFEKINTLLEKNKFDGDRGRLFHTVSDQRYIMPETLIYRHIEYLCSSILPIEPKWIDNLRLLLSEYLVQESRTNVRKKALNVFFKEILPENKYHHEKEIVTEVVVPFFSDIARERDPNVRSCAIEYLIDLCRTCETSHMECILDLFEKVLKISFEKDESNSQAVNDHELADMRSLVKGLRDIFATSIYKLPSSSAIRILSILVTFLRNHYKKPNVFESADIRWTIFNLLFELSVDSKYRLGLPDGSTSCTKYSPYLLVDGKRWSTNSLSAVSSFESKSFESKSSTTSSFEEETSAMTVAQCNELSRISLTNACEVVVMALKCEQDWNTLFLILQAIPKALKNKALVVSRHSRDVDQLINALIALITEKHLPEGLRNTPSKFSKPDFNSHVIPAISAFASYHAYLEFGQQQRLIASLKNGLVHKSAPQCVTALTTCLLEMREAMVKLLPDVLIELSKISATVYVAIPTLEFLSMLTTFPKVFANFTQKQYLTIFAIIFPYTNPFKYHHYTVSLAHHMIAVWFLKCRKAYREDLVRYIIKGLKQNVLSSEFAKTNETLNEDSSNRKRSSSLTEQSNKRRDRHSVSSGRFLNPRFGASTGGMIGGVYEMKNDENSDFHSELTDTCVDLMSRVTYSDCSALPKRQPGSEFVLNNGQSMTWLLGNKLITVTTSGCLQKPIRNGLCEKCSSYCVIDRGIANEDEQNVETTDATNEKRPNSADNVPLSPVPTQLTPTSASSFTYSPNPSVDEKKLNEISTVTGSDGNKYFRGDSDCQEYCVCWCQGWAEIHVRRPTGDVSWVIRLQNDVHSWSNSDPMIDASSICQSPVIERGIELAETKCKLTSAIEDESGNEQCAREPIRSLSDPLSESLSGVTFDFDSTAACSTKSNAENVPSKADNVSDKTTSSNESTAASSNSLQRVLHHHHYHATVDSNGEDGQASNEGRNPVRRSNSSPEMSSSWKNSYVKDSTRSFNNSPVNELEPQSQHGVDVSCTSECRKYAKCYPKELRGNCEAIPEEFSGQGTTPPKSVFPLMQADNSSNVIVDVDTQERAQSVNEENARLNSPNPTLAVGDERKLSSSTYPTSTTSSSISSSFSYEDVNPKLDEKRIQNRYFDKTSLPNEQFEFNRSASVSQVVPPKKKYQTSSGSVSLSQNLASSQPHLATKPPLSPPTYLSRSGALSLSRYSKETVVSRVDSSSLISQNQDYQRNRCNTISVMNLTKKPQSEWDLTKSRLMRSAETKKSGVNPSFVFLQLYETSQFDRPDERPLLVPSSQSLQRMIMNFDRIPPYETHRVGVIYVGPGQTNNEAEILRNAYGSVRYTEFLAKLGTLVNLAEVNPQNIFLGGLEQNGNDGKFAYIWKDDVMQVIFHVATLMPHVKTDSNCHDKKKHIGNDYVTIVYNESEQDYDLCTVKCQFNFACVIIEPLDHGSNQVTVKARDDLKPLIGHVEKKIVSDKNVSLLARQLALHINLASVILNNPKPETSFGGGIYASNWLERLRKIKHIRNRILKEMKNVSDTTATGETSTVRDRGRSYCKYDFTEYTSHVV